MNHVLCCDSPKLNAFLQLALLLLLLLLCPNAALLPLLPSRYQAYRRVA
jgi:hypothetical protein